MTPGIIEPPTGGDIAVIIAIAISVLGWIWVGARIGHTSDEHEWKIRALINARGRDRTWMRTLAAHTGVILPDDELLQLEQPKPKRKRLAALREWWRDRRAPEPERPPLPEAPRLRPSPVPRAVLEQETDEIPAVRTDTAADGLPANGGLKQARLTAAQDVDDWRGQFHFNEEGRRR